MPLRWRVLALLFAVRTTMAFQFQSVARLARWCAPISALDWPISAC
jgi:hypothetical protein